MGTSLPATGSAPTALIGDWQPDDWASSGSGGPTSMTARSPPDPPHEKPRIEVRGFRIIAWAMRGSNSDLFALSARLPRRQVRLGHLRRPMRRMEREPRPLDSTLEICDRVAARARLHGGRWSRPAARHWRANAEDRSAAPGLELILPGGSMTKKQPATLAKAAKAPTKRGKPLSLRAVANAARSSPPQDAKGRAVVRNPVNPTPQAAC